MDPLIDSYDRLNAVRLSDIPSKPPLQRLEERFADWLLVADPDVIKVTMAAAVANKMPGDPFWLFLVTAPSGLKTELISSLSRLDWIHPMSDLTAQTFASGLQTKGDDPSLLTKLDYGTVLTLKDFTTVLSMHRDRRQEILSQLREIYDGSYSKSWGTGKTLDWEGKLGLIAGVTTIIDTHYSIYQTLGERFIQYRVTQPDPEDVSLIAMRNQGQETEMRDDLSSAVERFFEQIDFRREVQIESETLRKLAALASFAVVARSGIIRDLRSKEIEYVPEPEAPPRLAKQLALFLKSAQLCGLTEADAYRLCQKLACDSIHCTRFKVIRWLHGQESATTTQAAEALSHPTNTIRRYLEDLAALKVLNVEKMGPGKADQWRVSERTRRLLVSADLTTFLSTLPLVSGGSECDLPF